MQSQRQQQLSDPAMRRVKSWEEHAALSPQYFEDQDGAERASKFCCEMDYCTRGRDLH